MQQPLLFPVKTLTVSEISRYLRALMESDEILRDVWVQGEISNLSKPSSGHVYFTLKDAASALKCVVWKMTAMHMPLQLQSGMAIEAHGAINIYERDGQYQLYVDAVRLAGEGALYQEYLRLKTRLETEGLFASERKREVPAKPRQIGIVTSPSGAALQDMLNTIRRRYPIVEVVIAPAAVQGEEAPPTLVEGIKRLNASGTPNVIILARGGGSLEDLWAFNDERVVRAVSDSRIPVVTGIGHETDFTLCDFVADQRAPTPTAAAEICTPDRMDLLDELSSLSFQLTRTIESQLDASRMELLSKQHQLEGYSPIWQVRNDLQRLDEFTQRMGRAIKNDLDGKHQRIADLEHHMSSLNPLAVLQRGYALVTDEHGRLVSSIRQVKSHDMVEIRVTDGNMKSQITEIRGGGQDDENG